MRYNDCVGRNSSWRIFIAPPKYTSIRRVWRHYLNYTFVLRVATEKRTFKIVPTFLPENESYSDLEEFLNRKALESTGAKKSP